MTSATADDSVSPVSRKPTLASRTSRWPAWSRSRSVDPIVRMNPAKRAGTMSRMTAGVSWVIAACPSSLEVTMTAAIVPSATPVLRISTDRPDPYSVWATAAPMPKPMKPELESM